MNLPVVSDLLSLILPERCHLCGSPLREDEKHLCAACMASLPREGRGADGLNRMERDIGTLPSVRMAWGWLTYQSRNETGQLIHDIKYHGYSRLARWLGRRMAMELLPGGAFAGADCITPVPLHTLRRLKRGYNQSEEIARGMAEATGLPVVRLLKCRRHRSQTRVGQERRAENVKGVYRMRRGAAINGLSPGRSPEIVLVDDVCTTGATLLNAAEAIERAMPGARLRLLALSLTFRH